jgi:hypothetical protein
MATADAFRALSAGARFARAPNRPAGGTSSEDARAWPGRLAAAVPSGTSVAAADPLAAPSLDFFGTGTKRPRQELSDGDDGSAPAAAADDTSPDANNNDDDDDAEDAELWNDDEVRGSPSRAQRDARPAVGCSRRSVVCVCVWGGGGRGQVHAFRRRHGIRVVGNDVPKPVTGFGNLQATCVCRVRGGETGLTLAYFCLARFTLRPFLRAALAASAYRVPTPIQMQAIPALLNVRTPLSTPACDGPPPDSPAGWRVTAAASAGGGAHRVRQDPRLRAAAIASPPGTCTQRAPAHTYTHAHS